MASRIETAKVEKGFYRSARFAALVQIGAAVFEPRLTGTFEKIVDANQKEWPALSPRYLAWKRKKGYSTRRWVRTGRTLKALSQGRFPKEGTRRGIRFKITPGRFFAVLRAGTFGPVRGKRPSTEVQKKIWKNLNYGIGVAFTVKRKGKRFKRSGFPARNLFTWQAWEKAGVARAAEAEIIRQVKGGAL